MYMIPKFFMNNLHRLTIIIFLTSCIKFVTSQADICTLTGQTYSNPFPSLLRCYIYNNDACCNSVHDGYIDSKVNGLLTLSCLRRYSALENLFCYGCHPGEPYFTNRTTKTVNLCLTFAINLWNSTNLDSPTTVFDNCGFKVTNNLQQYTSNNYVIPSQMFENFTDFITKIQIPFFEEYSINLVDDTKNPNAICFGSAGRFKINYFIDLILILVVLIF